MTCPRAWGMLWERSRGIASFRRQDEGAGLPGGGDFRGKGGGRMLPQGAAGGVGPASAALSRLPGQGDPPGAVPAQQGGEIRCFMGFKNGGVAQGAGPIFPGGGKAKAAALRAEIVGEPGVGEKSQLALRLVTVGRQAGAGGEQILIVQGDGIAPGLAGIAQEGQVRAGVGNGPAGPALRRQLLQWLHYPALPLPENGDLLPQDGELRFIARSLEHQQAGIAVLRLRQQVIDLPGELVDSDGLFQPQVSPVGDEGDGMPGLQGGEGGAEGQGAIPLQPVHQGGQLLRRGDGGPEEGAVRKQGLGIGVHRPGGGGTGGGEGVGL